MPLSATDNGDGTATLQVDTELTATIDPAGLATSAKQDTGNSSLSSINAKLPTLVGGKIPVDASVSIDSIDIGDVDIKEFPSGNLGQQLKTASLSVAPATDISDATYIGDIKFAESLPSGTALLGKVGIDQVTANANEVVVKSQTAPTTLPLPTGAATSANQADGNAALTAIEGETSLRDVGSPQRISQNSTNQSVPVPATAKAFFVVSEGGTSRFEIDGAASVTSTLVCFENGFLSYPITGGSQTLNTYGASPSIANVRFLA